MNEHEHEQDWRDVARQLAATDPRGLAGLAERIGYSRTALSLAVNGRYPAGEGRIAKEILGLLPQVACPFLGQRIDRQLCAAIALGAPPTTNPNRVRHWRACQRCAHKPEATT